MKTLREYIKEAEEKKVAIGHFNISNLEGFHGVYNAAKSLNVPVIIGLSEGEEEFIGREEAVALVSTIRERDNFPIFLNADHHHSFGSVKACIDAGFDSAIIDGAKLSFEDNVKITEECVDYARMIRKETGKDILIEAELGYIGEGSNIKDTIPEGAGIFTKTEDAKKFVEMTGMDMLAPSVGSIHGLIKNEQPHIDEKLVAEIKKATGIPLVLHGGSGLSDEDFTKAIAAGISIIHISTEIRLAYDEALKKSLSDNPQETTPYKILEPAVKAIEKIVEARLKLFNGIK
ncbi:MAG: class II fructose-bisphosphate aldolase family protein [Candidatus Pacebacteria bacterium]|nr:class II fructose-bisphosphate aldolase family protein [Candidatus Paceibacterota bacterium]